MARFRFHRGSLADSLATEIQVNSLKDIADTLYLSSHTVKNHIKSAYARLGVHEKSEFIRYAKDNNLFKE